MTTSIPMRVDLPQRVRRHEDRHAAGEPRSGRHRPRRHDQRGHFVAARARTGETVTAHRDVGRQGDGALLGRQFDRRPVGERELEVGQRPDGNAGRRPDDHRIELPAPTGGGVGLEHVDGGAQGRVRDVVELAGDVPVGDLRAQLGRSPAELVRVHQRRVLAAASGFAGGERNTIVDRETRLRVSPPLTGSPGAEVRLVSSSTVHSRSHGPAGNVHARSVSLALKIRKKLSSRIRPPYASDVGMASPLRSTPIERA
jgi:hypothetical protein